jgi:hypothetical protein
MKKNMWYLKFPHKILPFAKLSKPYQLAIVHYMAFDGEAWKVEGFPAKGMVKNWEINKIYLKKVLPEFVKKYGKVKFGVMNLPTKIMLSQHFKFNAFNEQKGFKNNYNEYLHHYLNNKNTVCHSKKNRWACILHDNYELLQDGWSRWHCYIQQKAKKIPCVFFHE